MAKKLYEESNIQNIADAIRGKNGSEDKYKVSEMASAIEGIPSGGNLEDFIPESAFNIKGNCSYRFAYGGWDWFLNKYRDRITTSNITVANRMFYITNMEQLLFDINFVDGGGDVSSLFRECNNLESIPPINFKQTSAKACE